MSFSPPPNLTVPVPPPVPQAVPQLVVVARRPSRRTRSVLSEVTTLVSSLAVVASISYLVYIGLPPHQWPTITPSRRASSPAETLRPAVAKGGGKSSSHTEPVVYAPRSAPKPPRPAPHPTPTPQPTDARVARADALVVASLKAAGEGMFIKANDLAHEARDVCSDHPAAFGAWYLAAYTKQYTELADEALTRLNGANDDVFLGTKLGRGAFVERNDDTYTFFVKGRHIRLTEHELTQIDGVRSGITRRFLDKADNPANHLILASIHYGKHLDETGQLNLAQPKKCLIEAVGRCKRVAERDGEPAEHARHMLSMFAWIESHTGMHNVTAGARPGRDGESVAP